MNSLFSQKYDVMYCSIQSVYKTYGQVLDLGVCHLEDSGHLLSCVSKSL